MPDKLVFPRRNLEAGEQWGRYTEDRIKSIDSRMATLESMVSGDNSAINGVMSNLDRVQDFVDHPALTYSFSRSAVDITPASATPVVYETFQVTAPEGYDRVELSASAWASFGLIDLRVPPIYTAGGILTLDLVDNTTPVSSAVGWANNMSTGSPNWSMQSVLNVTSEINEGATLTFSLLAEYPRYGSTNVTYMENYGAYQVGATLRLYQSRLTGFTAL